MENLNKELERLTGKPIAELEDLVRNSSLDMGDVTLKPFAHPLAAKQAKTQTDPAKCAQISLLKVVGAAVCADIKLDGDDWHIDIQLKLKLFGIEVFNRGGRLDKNHTEISFDIDLIALKAGIKIGVENFSRFCPYIDFNGEVYLPIHGWEKGHVRQQLFCFK